jgi:serine/threonine protein kinase
MAPEMTIGKGLDKPTVDYWALGIILFELLTGCTPFDGDSPEEMFENIRSNKVPWDQLEIGYDED